MGVAPFAGHPLQRNEPIVFLPNIAGSFRLVEPWVKNELRYPFLLVIYFLFHLIPEISRIYIDAG